MPSAQPELIEKAAYIRGFEQGRTQGMIDSQGGKNMIKAEWTNADALNLRPTCNQLATDCISKQAAIKAVEDLPNCYNGYSDTYDKAYIIGVLEELPSAQPEPTLEQIKEYCHKRCLSIVDNALLHKYKQAEIQPEIIRCKDCVYSQGEDSWVHCNRVTWWNSRDDFCSMAERRTNE